MDEQGHELRTKLKELEDVKEKEAYVQSKEKALKQREDKLE